MSLIERYTGKEPAGPIGECAWCGKPIYNDDHMYDLDVICPECDVYAYKGSTAVDYIVHLLKEGQVGSVISFFKDNRFDDWTEGFGEHIRTYFSEDYDKWVKF